MSRFTRLRNSVLKSAKGVQGDAVSITATSDGTGNGIIPDSCRFAKVTSASANYFVTLPAPTVGTVLYIKVGSTGFKLQSSAPATIAINAGSGAGTSTAAAANNVLKCICSSATTWLVTTMNTVGTESAQTAAA